MILREESNRRVESIGVKTSQICLNDFDKRDTFILSAPHGWGFQLCLVRPCFNWLFATDSSLLTLRYWPFATDSSRLFSNNDSLNDYIFLRHVTVMACLAGCNAFNFFNNIFAVSNFSKHRVAPTARSFA